MKVNKSAIDAVIEEIAHCTYDLLAPTRVQNVSEVMWYLTKILDDEIEDEAEAELRGLARGAGFIVPGQALGLFERAAPIALAMLKADGMLRSQRRKRGRRSSNNQPYDPFGPTVADDLCPPQRQVRRLGRS